MSLYCLHFIISLYLADLTKAAGVMVIFTAQHMVYVLRDVRFSWTLSCFSLTFLCSPHPFIYPSTPSSAIHLHLHEEGFNMMSPRSPSRTLSFAVSFSITLCYWSPGLCHSGCRKTLIGRMGRFLLLVNDLLSVACGKCTVVSVFFPSAFVI